MWTLLFLVIYTINIIYLLLTITKYLLRLSHNDINLNTILLFLLLLYCFLFFVFFNIKIIHLSFLTHSYELIILRLKHLLKLLLAYILLTNISIYIFFIHLIAYHKYLLLRILKFFSNFHYWSIIQYFQGIFQSLSI